MIVELYYKIGHIFNIRLLPKNGWFGLFCFVLSIFTLVFFTFHLSPSLAATPPAIITYQGKLLNSSSLAVTTTVSMKLVLYTALSSGSAVYSAAGTASVPTAISVTPTNGIFTVFLGDGSLTNTFSPDIFQNNQSLYLEIIIGSDTLTPRKQVTAAPYAYNAKYLDGVAATSTASSSTYIPISDSRGNFNFRHITSTDIYVSGTSTFVTTTFTGTVTVTKELIAQAIKDALGWIPNQATPARLSMGFNNGGLGGGATPGNLSMTSTDVSFFTPANREKSASSNAIFDGRYVYSVPYGDAEIDPGSGLPYNQALVTRYDTTQPYTTTSSWDTFDTITNLGFGNFFAGSFDGRYIYFAPANVGGIDGASTKFARYDTQTTSTFKSVSSWASYDVANALSGSIFTAGAVFDGRYMYFLPWQDGSNVNKVIRYDTTAPFATASSWSKFQTVPDIFSTNSNSFGGTFDGRYVYLAPYATGNMIRYDTTAIFTVTSSWSGLNISPMNASVGGFAGAVFDGRYVYYIPRGNTMARYDTVGSFSATSSWNFFKVTSFTGGVGSNYGGVFDGRYLYLLPTFLGSHGKVSIYDTSQAFTASSSWSVFNVGAVTGKTYAGGVFDGRYIYLVPDNADTSGFVRLKVWAGGTDSTQSIAKIARGSDFFINSSSSVGLGTTEPTHLLSLYAPASNTLGISIGNGITTTTLDHQNGFVFASSSAQRSGLFNLNISSGNTSVSGTLRTFGGTTGMGLSVSSTPTTNTIFSYYANTSVGNALVFDTNVAITSSTGALYSWRNNNFKLMSLSASGTLDVYGSINTMNATLGSPGVPGDLSERVDVLETQFNDLIPGDVMTLDLDYNDTYKKTTGNPTDQVMGVVATNPTLVLGNGKTSYTKIVTFLGRTNVKVSLKNGQIHKGDPLTNAEGEPGKAMRQTTGGPTIGTALEDYFEYSEKNGGQILTLVRPGWYGPSTIIANVAAGEEGIQNSVSVALQTVIDALKSLGIEIINGIVRIKQLAVNTIETGALQTKSLCLGNTCLDENSLRALLEKNNLANTSAALPDILEATSTEQLTVPDLSAPMTSNIVE